MAYSDNPRKIYGKVEVIYADEELSRDITTEESGNSEISNNRQSVFYGRQCHDGRQFSNDG